MTDATAEIVLLAGRLVRQLRRNAQIPVGYRVLASLEDLGSAGISQLAQEGYVAKAPHPTDARAQVLTLTPTGTEYLRAQRVRLAASVQGRLSGHSEADIATAIAVLTSLTEKGIA